MTTMLLARPAVTDHSSIVRMANQIAVAFLADEDPAAATADHIKTFWDPRMRAHLRAALAGGDGLHAVARTAALRLEAKV